MVNATGARWLRRLGVGLAVGLVVVLARLTLGVWPTSLATSAVGLWWGLRSWARLEARSRCRRTTAAELVPAETHLAFARALADVAASYLAACEREAGSHDR